MKFSTLALATVAVAVGVADAKRTRMSSEMIQTKLNRSANKRALVEKIRKLQNDGDDDGDAEFEITGDYSIRFNSCISMEIETDDNNNQNNQYYEGSTAVQEVLVVDLVSSDSSMPVQEVAMDIGTFVSSIGAMVYEQVESYCTVCQDIAESCEDGTSSSWLSQSGSAVSEEGTTIEFVDCDTCVLYNCYEENDDDGDDDGVDMESAFAYLTELSECQAFSFSYQNSEYAEAEDGDDSGDSQEQDDGQQQQGQGLYISYMCNEYGTGIDLGFFLDDECTMYTEEQLVADSISENSLAGQYLISAKSLIEGIFLNSFSCNSVEFAAPYSANDENDNSGYNFQYYGNNAEGEQDAPAANEYCQAVLEGENSVVIGTCSSSTYDSNGNVQSANADSGNSWYSRYSTNSNAEDENDDGNEEDELCAAIAEMKNNYAEAYAYGEEGAEGLFDFTYYGNQNNYGDEENDGNNHQQSSGYDYRSFGKANEEHRMAADQKSLGSVLLYVGLAVVAVAGAAYFFVYKKKETDEAKKQSLILEGDAGDYKSEGEIA